MKLNRDINTPIREELSWSETWESTDKGLIKCWENGRCISKSHMKENQKTTKLVRSGAIPPLDWVGGVDKKLKSKKYGCFNYLATLQGIKNTTLDINTDVNVEMTCSQTGTTVVFTADTTKWAGS